MHIKGSAYLDILYKKNNLVNLFASRRRKKKMRNIFLKDSIRAKQTIVRPFVDLNGFSSPPNPYRFIRYVEQDTVVEGIPNENEGGTYVFRRTVDGVPIVVKENDGFKFRTMASSDGTIKHVEVLFPDGHIEVWP